MANINQSSYRTAADDDTSVINTAGVQSSNTWGYDEQQLPAELVMIRLEHSGRPVVEHVGLSGLRIPAFVWCLHDFESVFFCFLCWFNVIFLCHELEALYQRHKIPADGGPRRRHDE